MENPQSASPNKDSCGPYPRDLQCRRLGQPQSSRAGGSAVRCLAADECPRPSRAMNRTSFLFHGDGNLATLRASLDSSMGERLVTSRCVGRMAIGAAMIGLRMVIVSTPLGLDGLEEFSALYSLDVCPDPCGQALGAWPRLS